MTESEILKLRNGELLLRNVRENSRVQQSRENRENYFHSCEAHGGELAQVVEFVRKEYGD